MSKLLASSKHPEGTRWRWALYAFKYAGEGFRLHRVRDNTFKRWKIFFDIPFIGGLSLYIQDIIIEEVFPPLPPLSAPIDPGTPRGAVIHCPDGSLLYTENFNEDFPEWKKIDGGRR